jgi:hypothetical protein
LLRTRWRAVFDAGRWPGGETWQNGAGVRWPLLINRQTVGSPAIVGMGMWLSNNRAGAIARIN